MSVSEPREVLEDVVVVKAEASGVMEPRNRELTLVSPLAGVEERERRLRPENN